MKKIISSLLAVAMTMSIASINAFAVTSATLSITDDVKTVKPGDIIEAVVKVDTTKGIANYTNTIIFDQDVFELVYSSAYNTFAADPENQAMAEEYEMEMVDVYSEMTGYSAYMSDTMIAYWDVTANKLPGGLSFMLNSQGYPLYLSNGASAVSGLKAAKNAVLAGAMLKVKDTAVAGETVISSADVAVSDGSADTKYATTPITITVEADAPSITKATYDVEEKDNKADKAEGEAYTQGFKVEVIGNDETVTAVPFTLKADGKEKAYAGFTGLNITGATPVYFGLNVKEVPADKTVAAEFSLTVAE